MITAEEKAIEIVENFYKELKEHKGFYDIETARQCGLIQIDSIMSLNIKYHGREIEDNLYNINYWQEVRREIEKLPA